MEHCAHAPESSHTVHCDPIPLLANHVQPDHSARPYDVCVLTNLSSQKSTVWPRHKACTPVRSQMNFGARTVLAFLLAAKQNSHKPALRLASPAEPRRWLTAQCDAPAWWKNTGTVTRTGVVGVLRNSQWWDDSIDFVSLLTRHSCTKRRVTGRRARVPSGPTRPIRPPIGPCAVRE